VTPERLQQIEELYHSAREREPGQRAAFLAEACRGDEGLRQELDQLLVPESSSGNILDSPAVDLLASSTVAQLITGTQIGPYKIEAPLGAGGMGEVYRAVDTRLKRTVAIKVAKENFGERFEREARVIAALNHPNVCTLYDVGPNYLVMELIEGKPLKGPLALDQALQYAGQICDALDAAHRKGIVHRDLKPGNILVTKQGIKLLDFGLARMAPGENDPTLTRPGVVMGTPAYMAPEQREGKPGDARSDIYAFGCVLHEMLTGKRPAQDRAPVEPAALEAVLGKCLEKDPEDRWQSARDLKAALEMVNPGRHNDPSPPVPRPGRLPWIAAAVLAFVAAALGIGLYRATRPAEQALKPLVRLDVDLGSDVSLDSERGTNAVLSPDGMRLVYLSQTRLFTRRLDQAKATELAGTEGALTPFFSPDGQWVGFFTLGKLHKISVEGGSAIALCDALYGYGGSWGEDGNIIAALGNGVLSRIPSAGGAPTPVTKLTQGEFTHRWPQVLPGGKAVLFTSSSITGTFDGSNIEAVSLADGRRKTLQRGGTFGRYVPSSQGRDGHLIYVSQSTLFAVPFDLEVLAVRGTPSPVLDQVSYSPTFGHAQFDFSQQGTLVYRSGRAEGSRLTVEWLDSSGRMQPLLAKPDFYQSARLSPDGQRLAISTTDLWVYDWQRETMTRLTVGGSLGNNNAPALWSPDGRYLIFRKNGEGLFWTRSDGAGQPQRLVQSTTSIMAYSFTPDGKRLAFRERSAGTGYDLWTMPVESDGAGMRGGKPEMFLGTRFSEQHPAFSPDGRWLAYTSNEAGTDQIFVRAFPDSGGQWQISDSGGSYPEWSRNGRELFFRTADNQIAVVAYTVKGDSFVSFKPRLWSEKPLAQTLNNGSNYNLAPDGKRIVVFLPDKAPEAQQAQNHVIFLINFFDELRRKVPARK
jgi:Tol biopolymer transport system component/predicted Ser/Thr protein kinase